MRPISMHPACKALASNRERRFCPSPLRGPYAISSCNLKTKLQTKFSQKKNRLKIKSGMTL